jgi:D-cysteine desulfhydrase
VSEAAAPSIALFERFPGIERALPRAPLCELPTPLARAEKLEREARLPALYVKRDERSAHPYGGNKPRKLEWIFGRALARGARRVLTFGALGTNHGLATALYAKRLGLECDLVLVRQPVDAAVRRKLLLDHAAGARLVWGRNVAGAAAQALVRLARHPRTCAIPTGGSNADGALGFVNAGLELAAQVAAGELVAPARVYLAVGSGGSAAGLAAGLALAGLPTRVVGVLVTDILPPSERSLAALARRALERLARAGASLPRPLPALALELERGFAGPGYAVPTAEGSDALRRAAELEGLELDATYTAKALAALLARERGTREPVVFWNSYAGAPAGGPLPDWRELPRSFHRFFEDAP